MIGIIHVISIIFIVPFGYVINLYILNVKRLKDLSELIH